MGRKKKVVDTTEKCVTGEVEYVDEVISVMEEVKVPVILPLTLDFNKEDMNTLVMKVNEIISYINR